jgi:hypothetical protein
MDMRPTDSADKTIGQQRTVCLVRRVHRLRWVVVLALMLLSSALVVSWSSAMAESEEDPPADVSVSDANDETGSPGPTEDDVMPAPAEDAAAYEIAAIGPADCTGSLQTLVNAAPAGGVVSVPPCVFRETVTIAKPLTVSGVAGAEIRGSDVWTVWTNTGNSWLSDRAVPSFPTVSLDPNACEAGTNNRCLWPEQVFVDGRPLTEVAFGTSPGGGQFALVSAGDRRVRLGDNPTGHRVEVTTRPRWIVTNADGVTIQGLTMRHAANSAVTGAISNDGRSNWLLRDSTLVDAHGADVRLDGGVGARLVHNDISRGGLSGVAGVGVSQNGLIQNNRIYDNAIASFSRDWGAAGIKVTEMQGLTIDGNEVSHNDGVGLWCDINCRNVTFSNNRVHHNQWQGINFEISDGASIHDNAVWENGWGNAAWGWGAGIVISSSANADVYNNTVAWNYAGISVISQARPDALPAGPVGDVVHHNTIVQKTFTGDYSTTFWRNLSLAWLSDGSRPLFSLESRNRGFANRFWYDAPENQWVRFTWTDLYASLADLAQTAGGAGSAYVSTADMDVSLVASQVPLSPEPR